MKIFSCLKYLPAIALVLIIASCATGNRLTFVKTRPAGIPHALTSKTEATSASVAVTTTKDNTSNTPIITASTVDADKPIAITTTQHSASATFNKHISTTTSAIAHSIKATGIAAITKLAKPAVRADEESRHHRRGGMFTGLVLVILGLIMFLFYGVANIGWILVAIGGVLIVIGIIAFILWLL